MARSFDLPPRKTTRAGTERRVGFEFEFSGVGLQASAEIVARIAHGTVEQKHRFSYKTKGTRFGEFLIESDSSMLTGKKWEKYLRLLGFDPTNDPMTPKIEALIETVSEDLVPFEIVTPPIPLSEIDFVEDLRQELQMAGAKGTHTRFFAAYGLQFNPEMPDFSVATLLGYQRAFFLLYDRLLALEDMPIARKVLPFIDPFPQEYIDIVLNPEYAPTLKTFMRDYLEYNSTRNRALDWLPLFAYLDRDFTFSYPVEVELVKPRPTLHYRLPSSLIDDPKWSIADEWNKWNEVEKLANNPAMIKSMTQEYFELHGPFQLLSASRWARRTSELLNGQP